MGIHEEIREEMKEALRARDQKRLDVLRAIETEIKVARSAPGFSGHVDDELYERVIAAYVKKMNKALLEYEKLGEKGREQAEKLRFEVEYLARWLPKQLGPEQIRILVEQAIQELGVEDVKQAGRVVGHVMKAHKGTADGRLVKQIAEELLGGKNE